MTVTDMEIYEPQKQSLGSLGLLSCSAIYYEQLCESFIVAVENSYTDCDPSVNEVKGEKNA